MKKEQFGRLLVILRKQRGMSQKELAAGLAVSASAVSKWEHGSNLPDMAMIDRIAVSLGVTCDDLMNPERTLERLQGEPGAEMRQQAGSADRFEEKKAGDESVRKGESAAECPKKAKKRLAAVAMAAALLLLGMAGGFALKEEVDRVTEEDLGLRPVARKL